MVGSAANPDLLQTDEVVRVLRQVSTEINATLDLDEILQVVLHTMDELFGFRHSIVLLLDEDAGALTVVASRGYHEGAVGARVAMGVGVIGTVAKRRRIMRVTNLAQQRAYLAAARKQMEAAGRGEELADIPELPGLTDAQSQIAIPMLIKDTLIGVLSVESERIEPLDEQAEVLLSIVANQSASAIHNARLFRAEAEGRRELAAAHEELKQLAESLEERVRERTRELEEAHVQLVQAGKMASIGKLAAGVAHEMNSPLASVVSSQDTLGRAVRRLRERLDGDSHIEGILHVIEDSGRAIHDGSERVDQIVSRLRNFTSLDQANLQRVDVREGLRDTLALARGEIGEDVSVHLEFEEVDPIACYPGSLNQAFLNLLTNAARAVEHRGNIWLRVWQDDHRIYVSVRDDGVGIAPETQSAIFEPGFRTGAGRVGASMGLPIARHIVQDHHGTLQLESTAGEGSTFTISLPRDRG